MSDEKILTLDSLRPILHERRRHGDQCVFTNGAFGFLHPGHVYCLQAAAREGNLLVVALNTDESFSRIKGRAPVFTWSDRAFMLAALRVVSYVIPLEEDTPHALFRAIQSDVLAKGPTSGGVVGREIVEAYGGRVVVTDEFGGYSVTEILQKLRLGL